MSMEILDPTVDARQQPLTYVARPDSLAGKVNETATPRSHSLARLGWKTSMALRSLGLHQIVEIAKRAGLRKHFFGSPGGGPRVSFNIVRSR